MEGGSTGTRIIAAEAPPSYADGRPAARYRLPIEDQGAVLEHGRGPDSCDYLGARDVWVFEHRGKYYMHYDGAGPKGWLSCLAVSTDLLNWTPRGPILELGAPGSKDAASASYGSVYQDGQQFHMFYLGTPNVSPAPERVPMFPYQTMKAESDSPTGPWKKRYEVTPFVPRPGSYYSGSASPGQIIRVGDEYRMPFSASTVKPILRTLSFARTRHLDSTWKPDPKPFLPLTEQIENATVYFEEANQTWFLFTNHVGFRKKDFLIKDDIEYTDAIWVYWTKDPDHWNPDHKAVVLDTENCRWSRNIIGLPSVLRVGNRLALFYDGHSGWRFPTGIRSHMNRDIGLAWLNLPLIPPDTK